MATEGGVNEQQSLQCENWSAVSVPFRSVWLQVFTSAGGVEQAGGVLQPSRTLAASAEFSCRIAL